MIFAFPLRYIHSYPPSFPYSIFYRKFPKLDKAMVYEMDRVFSHDIPKLLEKASRRPEHGEGAWEGGSDPYRRGGRR